MARYPSLRSTLDFTEDEVEPIVAEDTSAVDEALNRKMKQLLAETDAPRAEDEALNAGMRRLLAKTPTRAQAASQRALDSMRGKKQSVSEEDLLSVTTPDNRPVAYEMDLREKTQPELAMDLRSPRERADQNEAAFSKKKDDIGESLASAAAIADDSQAQSSMRAIRKNNLRASEKPGYAYDPMAEKLGYAPMESGARQAAQEDTQLVSPTVTEDEWDSIYKPAPAAGKTVPANADWNTAYPDKSAKPVIEDDHDVIIRRGKETWSNARGMIPGAEFAAMSPEDQAHYRKTHYLGPNGNWLKRDGEVPAAEGASAGEVVSAGAQESKKPLVPSAGEAAASSGKREIPSALLERLRAARAADALGESTSSLGRLLTATAAQYGGLKEAPALLQDYNQKANRKSSAFEDELAMAKAEKDAQAEADEDSTTSDIALTGQHIARQLGMPEEAIKNITGKSAKLLIAMLGNKTKLDLEDKKQTGNTERTHLKGGYDITKEAIKSGDRRYAVDHRKSIARALGLGKASNDPKTQAKFDAEVTKFVHSLPKGFGSSLRALDAIGQIIVDNGGEAPGIGPLASLTPDKAVGLFYGKDARKLRLLANGIYNDYIHNNFGTAFTGPEQARFEAAMAGISPDSEPETFVWGLSELQDLITKKVEQEAAGRRDEVVQAAIERGLPAIPGSVRPALRGPGQGGPAAPAPKAAPQAQRPLKKAGGKVYTKGANGDAVEVPLDQLTPEERQRLGV